MPSENWGKQKIVNEKVKIPKSKDKKKININDDISEVE